MKMNKARKRFLLYATLAVFVSLAALLTVINGINFTKVAEDADRVTEMIAAGRGVFPVLPEGARAKPGVTGPDSPELPYSARYFTYRFNRGGNMEEVAFDVSAFTKEEASRLAINLIGGSTGRTNGTTGWTEGVYRYRVYNSGDFTYVTVLDQSRELHPSYRILRVSLTGGAVLLCVCFVFLLIISRRLFLPLEEADRKQKKFIEEAENRFKLPLTVIAADAEIIEKEQGASEYTGSIRRSAASMLEFTKQLGGFSVFENEAGQDTLCDLSGIFSHAADIYSPRFEQNGKILKTDIADGVTLTGDRGMLERTARELLENAYKFSLTQAFVSLKSEDGRISLTVSNDAGLKDAPEGIESIFDRFTRLSNAGPLPGSGLGLAYVRDAVKKHNGRIKAEVTGGAFTLRVTI